MNPLETRELGSTGLSLPILGFGGAPLGELFEKIPETQAQETLKKANAGGIRYFDTAPWYGYGFSEHRLVYLLRQRRLRRVFFFPLKWAGFTRLFQAMQSASKEHPGQEDCPSSGVSIIRATVSGGPSRTVPFDWG